MSMSCADAGWLGAGSAVRRFEVFTGAGRRREWSEEAKAAIVAESYSGVESVSAVARRHGLGHSQLFTWRRQLRGPTSDAAGPSPLLTSPSSVTEQRFVPVVVAAPSANNKGRTRKRRPRSSGKAGPTIELEIDGVSVRVPKGTDPRTISAVIQALKGSS